MEVADIQTAETPTPFKPAVGRIVHFFYKNQKQGEPAIITRVHNDTCVNLSVFVDGSSIVACHSSVTTNPNDNVYWIPPTRI